MRAEGCGRSPQREPREETRLRPRRSAAMQGRSEAKQRGCGGVRERVQQDGVRVRSSSTSSMADMGLATREDDHGDRIEPEREMGRSGASLWGCCWSRTRSRVTADGGRA